MTANTPQQAPSAFSESLDIGGQLFTFAFQYNTRGDFWTVDVGLPDGTPLYLGRKLILGAPLFAGAVVDGLPEGLCTLDATGLLARCGRADLGQTVNLYVDA